MDLFIALLLAIVAFDVLFVATRVRAALRQEPRPIAHSHQAVRRR